MKIVSALQALNAITSNVKATMDGTSGQQFSADLVNIQNAYDSVNSILTQYGQNTGTRLPTSQLQSALDAANQLVSLTPGIIQSAVNALPADQTAVAAAAKAVALDSLTSLNTVGQDALDLTNMLTIAMQDVTGANLSTEIQNIIKSAVQLVTDTVVANSSGSSAADSATIAALQANLTAAQAQLSGYTNVVTGKLPIDLSDLLCCGGGGLLKMYNNMTMNIHPVEVTASLNTVVTINEIYNIDHGTTTFSNTTQTCTGQQNCAADHV